MDKQLSSIQDLIEGGELEKALDELKRSNTTAPWRDSLYLRCLRMLNRGQEALKFAKQLYSTKPTDTEQLRFIAIVFSEQNEFKTADKLFKKLCLENPLNADIHSEYGTILSSNGQLDNAEIYLKKSLDIHPSNVNAHSQLARIYCRTGRVQEGLNSFQRAAILEPNKAHHLQRIAYWSNYSELTTQQSNFQMARLWASKAYPENQSGSNTWRDANPDKPLKIGFVSADFCAHAVSFFITPLLKNLDRNAFQVFAFSDVKKPDHITEQIKMNCDVWHDSSRQTDKALSAQIGASQLDILVDLGGHTASNRMGVFSQHLAPIQISWLGYPSTTGLKSINYRITDDIADPPTTFDYYSEELIRLSCGFLCYQPLNSSPDIIYSTQNKQSDKKRSIRFASFNNLAKISPLTFDAWSAALKKVPHSTLYIKRQQLINKTTKKYIIDQFKKRGIDKKRLILKTSKAKIEQHLAEYNSIDIALDTSPYNGTTTTLEALWMGRPVISLSGKTHASRVSSSILHRLDLDDLVTYSIDEFADKAKELSNDKKRLTKIANTIRQTMKESALLDHALFSRRFEQAIRGKWRQWCLERNKEHGIENKEKIIGDSEHVSERV